MAWREPAKMPPVIVAVRAEIAVMDCIARLVMGGAKAAQAVVAFVKREDELGRDDAWRDVGIL